MAAPTYNSQISPVQNLQLLLKSLVSTVTPENTFQTVVAQLLHYLYSTALALTGTLSVGGASTLTGAVTLGAGLVGSIQSLSGAGAVNLTTLTTALTSTGGAQALTLANGTAGQIKIIVHEVDGGSSVLTPTTKTGFTTITFTNAGESAMLQYFTTRGWVIVSLNGAVAA